MNQTWENGKKSSFAPNFGPFDPNSGCQFFFFKNMAPSVTRNHGQLSSCTISGKTDCSWKNLVRGGQMNRWTEAQEWFHRSLSI